jgi:hypothetical protein
MKKVSTAAMKLSRNFSQSTLTDGHNEDSFRGQFSAPHFSLVRKYLLDCSQADFFLSFDNFSAFSGNIISSISFAP